MKIELGKSLRNDLVLNSVDDYHCHIQTMKVFPELYQSFDLLRNKFILSRIGIQIVRGIEINRKLT